MSDFAQTGAICFRQALGRASLGAFRDAADFALQQGPGARLTEVWPDLTPVHKIAVGLTSDRTVPVRAVVFDKSAESNWAVAWHQDRTIVVDQRTEVAGFGPWSTKQGLLHVAPPAGVLARMITIRLHLDPCGEGNAPLKAALGSHLLGRVSASDAAVRAAECEIVTCLAEPGDVWAYSTLILHASDRAAIPARRRVIQLDYADFALPGGLRWRGLGA